MDEESSNFLNNWPLDKEEWLIKMLKQHHCTNNDIKVVEYSRKKECNDASSNLSDILSISLVYNIAQLPTEVAASEVSSHSEKLELIIKLLPHDPFSRYFVIEAKFDFREMQFYTNIVPALMEFQNRNIKMGSEKMTINVPKCFYTHYPRCKIPKAHNCCTESLESFLVLEDMRSSGYTSIDFIRGLNLEQAEYAIKAIASVHALTLGLKLKEKINLNEKFPFLFQINKATESYQQLLEQGLPQLLRFLQQKGNFENEINALEQLRLNTKVLITNLLEPSEPMAVMTHTDFWCNNLLFKKDPDDHRNDNCVILDWQMITYSRPTNDIALLITTSLPSNIRRQHLTKLLDLYYNLLRSNSAKLSIDLEVDLQYSRNKLECDFRKSQLLSFLLCVGSVDMALGSSDAEQRLLDVLHDFYEEKILTNYDH